MENPEAFHGIDLLLFVLLVYLVPWLLHKRTRG